MEVKAGTAPLSHDTGTPGQYGEIYQEGKPLPTNQQVGCSSHPGRSISTDPDPLDVPEVVGIDEYGVDAGRPIGFR